MSYGQTPRRATARATTGGQGRWQRRGMLLIGLLALGLLAAIVAGASAELPIKLPALALEPPAAPDRVYVVMESTDRNWRVSSRLTAIDSGSGQTLFTIADADDAILSPDGSQLFILRGRELRGHDAATGAQRWARGFDELFGGVDPATAPALAASADGKTLFAIALIFPERGIQTRRLYQLDAASGAASAPPIELPGLWETSQWLAAPDGARLYEVLESGQILAIDLAQGRLAARISLPHAALGAAITPDGAALYVLSSSFEIIEIDLRANAVAATRPLGGTERARPGGLWLLPGQPPRLLVGAYNYARRPLAELRLFDLTDWRELSRVGSDLPFGWDLLALGAGGRQMFAATDGGLRDDNTIRAFDLASGESRLLLDAPLPSVRRVLAGPPFIRRLPAPVAPLAAPPAAGQPAPAPADPAAPLAYVFQYRPDATAPEILAVGADGAVASLAANAMTLAPRPGKPPLLLSMPDAMTLVISDPGAGTPLTITLPPGTALGPGGVAIPPSTTFGQPALAPDGRTLILLARDASQASARDAGAAFLLSVDLRSGATRRIELPTPASALSEPAAASWGADGLTVISQLADETTIYRGDPLAEPVAWREIDRFKGSLLAFHAGAGLAVLADSRDGRPQVIARTIGGEQQAQLFDGAIPGFGKLAISPDGGQVALLLPKSERQQPSATADLYVYDTAGGTGEVWERKLEFSPSGGWLSWAAGGRRLAVAANANGRSSQQHSHILVFDGAGGGLIDKIPLPQTGTFTINERDQFIVAEPGFGPDDPARLLLYQLPATDLKPVEILLQPGYPARLYMP